MENPTIHASAAEDEQRAEIAKGDAIYDQCVEIIERMTTGLEVLDETLVEDHDGNDPKRTEKLRALRYKLLRFTYDEFGDPESEEALARDGQPT